MKTSSLQVSSERFCLQQLISVTAVPDGLNLCEVQKKDFEISRVIFAANMIEKYDQIQGKINDILFDSSEY